MVGPCHKLKGYFIPDQCERLVPMLLFHDYFTLVFRCAWFLTLCTRLAFVIEASAIFSLWITNMVMIACKLQEKWCAKYIQICYDDYANSVQLVKVFFVTGTDPRVEVKTARNYLRGPQHSLFRKIVVARHKMEGVWRCSCRVYFDICFKNYYQNKSSGMDPEILDGRG